MRVGAGGVDAQPTSDAVYCLGGGGRDGQPGDRAERRQRWREGHHHDHRRLRCVRPRRHARPAGRSSACRSAATRRSRRQPPDPGIPLGPHVNRIAEENAKPGDAGERLADPVAGDDEPPGLHERTSATTSGETAQFKITRQRRLRHGHLPDGLLQRQRGRRCGDRRGSRSVSRARACASRQPATTRAVECIGVRDVADPTRTRSPASTSPNSSAPTNAARATSSSSSATTPRTRTSTTRRPTRRGRPTTSYGGNSLYDGGVAGLRHPARAYKVSYDRPFATRGVSRAPGLRSSTPSTR